MEPSTGTNQRHIDVVVLEAEIENLHMRLPGMAELSYCRGYYHHELLRTGDGWCSRSPREENVWFINSPGSWKGTEVLGEHRQVPGLMSGDRAERWSNDRTDATDRAPASPSRDLNIHSRCGRPVGMRQLAAQPRPSWRTLGTALGRGSAGHSTRGLDARARRTQTRLADISRRDSSHASRRAKSESSAQRRRGDHSKLHRGLPRTPRGTVRFPQAGTSSQTQRPHRRVAHPAPARPRAHGPGARRHHWSSCTQSAWARSLAARHVGVHPDV